MIQFKTYTVRTIVALAGLVLLATQSGCFSVPLSANLRPPEPSSLTLDATAWIGTVEITDARARRMGSLSDALALSIRDYAEGGRFFRGVKMLPGKPSHGEYILDFKFSEFYQRRKSHPAYFPAAILTLTLYIWVGGPIYVDTVDLAGTLEVTTADGRLVATSSSSIHEKSNKSLYSDGYMTADVTAERTQLVRELLEKAVIELNGRRA